MRLQRERKQKNTSNIYTVVACANDSACLPAYSANNSYKMFIKQYLLWLCGKL